MAKVRALKCIRCGNVYPPASVACARCCEAGAPSILTAVYDAPVGLDRNALPARPASLWRFADFLPVAASDAISLGEGATPLVRLGSRALEGVLVKDESRNPTASFKDRLASVAVSAARAAGARVIACASSGNAGASVAAYSARAGLPCVVFALRNAPPAMLAQIEAYGAMTIAAARPADRWTLLKSAAERYGWFATSPFSDPPIGSNPIGIEGYKTLAYEIAEALDWRAPDWCALPVCYGDALFGLWKGFDELLTLGWIARRPRLIAAEIAGSLEMALAQGLDTPPRVQANKTSVAISIDAPRSTFQALYALRQSNGVAVKVSDDDIQASRHRLAREEGLFAEASSAAPFPAVERLRNTGTIRAGETVVAVMTASGLKDAPSAAAGDLTVISADLDALREALAKRYDFHV